jgi:hypothetical protein
MSLFPVSRRTSASLAVLATALATAALAAGPGTSAASVSTAHAAASQPSKTALLHPAKKYFGVSVAGAPGSLSGVIPTKPGVANVTTEVNKQPNLLMFYSSWGGGSEGTKPTASFSGEIPSIKKACDAGLLPMLTWESWNTSARIASNPGVAYTQPAFKMSNIVAGDYDTYIRDTAQDIASLGCPIAIRFDQEQNGYWYPWGVSNTNENGPNMTATGAEYIKMWKHVWTIFNNAGANKNVIWTWSPNWQSGTHPKLPLLQASYPGSAYVDWIAIDAYYAKSGDTFATVFDSTIVQLNQFARTMPWIVGETAVGDFPDKASMITNLLTTVAKRAHFNGFVYFDQHKTTDRSFWPFQETTAAQNAFKAGIASSRFAAGKAGTF